MRSTDSKIADLLPRVVERPARRSDEKEEEPWVKPRQPASPPAASLPAALPAGTSIILVSFVLLASLLGFAVTGVGVAEYPVFGAGGQELTLRCIGAPLVHTSQLHQAGGERQFFAAAIVFNGLLWIGIAAAVSWGLYTANAWCLAAWESGQRQFTLGQLLALSIGVAVALAAWRWDLVAWIPWQSDLAAVEKALEASRPIGPGIQPLMRFSVLAAAYAYLGAGCGGLYLASGTLWIIRQFLPRRPGEDKSLLQQIF